MEVTSSIDLLAEDNPPQVLAPLAALVDQYSSLKLLLLRRLPLRSQRPVEQLWNDQNTGARGLYILY